MGKAKKSTLKKRLSKPFLKPGKPSKKPNGSHTAKKRIVQPPPWIVPFRPTDHILLVGEGDFSFSHALLTTHGCSSLLATSFDAHSIVLAKYPQAASNIEALEAAREKGSHVLFEVDATKIGTSRSGSGGKATKKGGFDRIVFNFPHVGGLTKDVSRQILHNQQLLVGFFKAAVPLLAPNGTIIVTVFEGKPYETWDLKGLAKDAGLKSQRSFKFQGSAYPGYKHARTLGNIEGGRGWKGEERPARTYLLEVNDGPEGKNKKANGEATGANMDLVVDKREVSRKQRKEGSDSDDD